MCGTGIHISANHCLGQRPSSLAVSPGCGESYQSPADIAPPTFSQLLLCIVGLSSTGSTKHCWVCISYMANLYSSVSLKEAFTIAFCLLRQTVQYVFCLDSWKLVKLQERKVHSKQEAVKEQHSQSSLPELFFRLNWLNGPDCGKSFVFRPSLCLFLCLSFELNPQLRLVWLMAAIH